MKSRFSQSCFTLVELLVVIAIIGILVALLLPAVQAAREAARRTQCINNLKQLALACHNYENTYKSFPINYARVTAGSNYTSPPDPSHRSTSWMTAVLPFVEQQPLYDLIDFNYDVMLDPRQIVTAAITNPANPSNAYVARTVIPAYRCPSDGLNPTGLMNNRANRGVAAQEWAAQNYKGVCGANWAQVPYVTVTPPAGSPLPNFNNTQWAVSTDGLDTGNGIFYRGANTTRPCHTKMAAVLDGTANTFMIGETIPRWCTHTWWFHFNGVTGTTAIPLNAPAVCASATSSSKMANLNACWGFWQHNYSFMSMHPGGANFAMADASTQFVSTTIDLQLYRSLGTMQNGEAVTLP